MPSLPRLDPQQQRAVLADEHCVVPAIPGSGKTRVLAARAARLLSKGAAVAAVTFTKDAADELRSRIIEYGGKGIARRLKAGTFHSLAMRQLKDAGESFSLINAGEQWNLLRQAYYATPSAKKLGLEVAVKAIEKIKSGSESPPSRKDPVGAYFAAYQQLLEGTGHIDFADLLLQTVGKMREGALAPLAVAFLLVDEAQDMDEAQKRWVECHADQGVKVTLVGDDDQSIYEFRNALGYEGMQRFVSRYHAAVLSLENNYRSLPDILQPAGRLIKHNEKRIPKELRAVRKGDGLVQVARYNSRAEEAEAVLSAVRDEPERWAVLARTNQLLDAVEIALKADEVPCSRNGGKSFWESFEASMLLRFLKSLATGDSGGAVLPFQWLGMPVTVLERARQHATDGASLLPDGLLKAIDEVEPGETAMKALVLELHDLWEHWRQSLACGRDRLVILGVCHWFTSRMEKEREVNILSWSKEALAKMSGSLEQRIQRLTMSGKASTTPGVQILTLHGSKGLEFPCVWMVANEEGVLPHEDSSVEEERRLAYVGMSRAMDVLMLSYSTEAKPSRFLVESGLS